MSAASKKFQEAVENDQRVDQIRNAINNNYYIGIGTLSDLKFLMKQYDRLQLLCAKFESEAEELRHKS